MLALALVGLALALPSLRSRLGGSGEAPVSPTATTAVPVSPSPAPSVPESPRPTAAPSPSPSPTPRTLTATGKPRLDAQVRKVVDSMDRTGRPPRGVEQGGRQGRERGVFQNLERRLPAKPAGYYRESDVWPRGPTGRGAERLVFGREGEVYYTKDHYRSFTRLR